MFESWKPAACDVVAESDWQQFCPYQPHSAPLLLPGAGASAAPTLLPLFGAASASTAGTGLAAAADAGPGSSAAGPPASAAGSSGASLSRPEAMDVILHTGGPVWATDWCPAGTQAAPSSAGAAGAAPTTPGPSYLAVGCHPLEMQQNVIGTTLHGPACIQVWELSHPDQPGSVAGASEEQQQQQQPGTPSSQGRQQGPQLPRMALALAHGGGVTYSCRWCPDPALTDAVPAAAAPGSSGTLPRLGLLAAVLGDGSVRVWAVPHPQATATAAQHEQQQQQQQQQRQQPLVVSLPPVAAASSAALGGSMPSVVDWLPAAPHDLLAVGCWDGTLAILRLLPGQRQHAAHGGDTAGSGSGSGLEEPALVGLELLSHFASDVLPLRTLRWVPPEPCGTCLDGLGRQLIVTGGHEGTLRLWDLRDTFQPVYSHVLSSNSTILSADWTSRPLGILVAMEDASLRGVLLDSTIVDRAAKEEGKAMFSISWRGPNMGALWSVAVQPHMQVVAYGEDATAHTSVMVVAYAGEDGEVGVYPAEYEGNSKRRLPHSAVAGLRMEGAALAVRPPGQVARDHGLFAGRVVERTAVLHKARLPEEQEAVHRVAWSAHAGGGAWLASGGAAGIVRCQWIQSQ